MGRPRGSRCFLWSSFEDPSLERLYQSYSVRQKRAGLECFLVAAVLFDVYMLVIPSGQDLTIFGAMSGFLVSFGLWRSEVFRSGILIVRF